MSRHVKNFLLYYGWLYYNFQPALYNLYMYTIGIISLHFWYPLYQVNVSSNILVGPYVFNNVSNGTHVPNIVSVESSVVHIVCIGSHMCQVTSE